MSTAVGRCPAPRGRSILLGQRLSSPAVRPHQPQQRNGRAQLITRSVSSPRQSSTLGKTDRRIFAAKRYFHSLWNDSKVDVLSEIASESIIHSDKVWLDYDLVGIKRVKQLYSGYMAGYPDCHYDITAIGAAQMLSESEDGNMDTCVMVHWRFRGTNLGTLWDVPPSGRHSEFSGVHVLRFDEDDHISRIESYRQSSKEEHGRLSMDMY
uniref:SnoaL-like domain-containing protein n=1 Tax=Tetraselmis chuii TaxID=63592 RepID=A0A7S1SVM1_9CHLO|mmetsp:Transcript_31801/g.56924  ORF Transcript_31801/g.56924 Transcript_31801/m.56924 type:complete len:209 (+) Transcript_31801:339-965(+)|eukprot:CAMPEP_0177751024 /NCGR_PEP_ID=MMETSP0491_2-20121128/153_1 /TAXON_ID=63592 /ORGANISM="Tetraselmis chuii, Strain PLY429" /LENGTH=208 /DNA_ID=CAMNT_0019266109 /DNA_START=324 /DNA_END=950 /DNA_ORIENTATION=-